MAIWVPKKSRLFKATSGWPNWPNEKPYTKAKSKWKEHTYLFRHNFAPEGFGTLGTKVGTGSLTWEPEGWYSAGSGSPQSAGVEIANLGTKVTEPFTVVMRFRNDSYVAYATPFEGKAAYNGNGIHVYTGADNALYVRDDGSPATFTITTCWADGDWINFVLRHDGASFVSLDVISDTYGKKSNSTSSASITQGSTRVVVGAADAYNYSPEGVVSVFRFIEEMVSDAEADRLVQDVYYGLEPANQTPSLIGTAAAGGAYQLDVTAGSLTLTGGSVGLAKGSKLNITAGALTLSGGTVTLTKQAAYQLDVTAGALTLTGGSVSLTADRKLQVTAGALELGGQTVTLTYTPVGAYQLDVTAGNLTLTGQSVSLNRTYALQVTAGDLSLTGGTVTLTHTVPAAYQLDVTAGSLDLTGGTVTLTHSGAVTLADVYSLLQEIHAILGLTSGSPMTVTPTSRVAGSISQTISGDGVTSTTVTRDP